ncbi:hypothetical protein [Prescottella subtropica]|uniref:hypothetical protein n=1 Tax=Prescottella subtropica TaxID=2545757 RepID=UPI0010F4FDB0|nr:hypothetical protein [Prescottella subtropica]
MVASLRDSGLSIRAIASATGNSINTVQGDLREVSQTDTPAEPRPVTGTDGKTYTPKQRVEIAPRHIDRRGCVAVRRFCERF